MPARWLGLLQSVQRRQVLRARRVSGINNVTSFNLILASHMVHVKRVYFIVL